jgi:hypothetical protein
MVDGLRGASQPACRRVKTVLPMTRDAKSDRPRVARDHSRAKTLLTDFAYHFPPRGVVIPRAFNASAI